MPFHRIPLKVLVKKSDVNWDDFLKIAELPKKDRPSYRSAGIFWGVEQRTVKAWLQRYDEGEDNE